MNFLMRYRSFVNNENSGREASQIGISRLIFLLSWDFYYIVRLIGIWLFILVLLCPLCRSKHFLLLTLGRTSRQEKQH